MSHKRSSYCSIRINGLVVIYSATETIFTISVIHILQKKTVLLKKSKCLFHVSYPNLCHIIANNHACHRSKGFRYWSYIGHWRCIFLKTFLPLNFHPVSNMPIFQQSWKSSDSKIKLEGSKNAEKINRSIEVEYCRR